MPASDNGQATGIFPLSQQEPTLIPTRSMTVLGILGITPSVPSPKAPRDRGLQPPPGMPSPACGLALANFPSSFFNLIQIADLLSGRYSFDTALSRF